MVLTFVNKYYILGMLIECIKTQIFQCFCPPAACMGRLFPGKIPAEPMLQSERNYQHLFRTGLTKETRIQYSSSCLVLPWAKPTTGQVSKMAVESRHTFEQYVFMEVWRIHSICF